MRPEDEERGRQLYAERGAPFTPDQRAVIAALIPTPERNAPTN